MSVPGEAYRVALAAWAETPTLEHVLEQLQYEGWIGPVPLVWAGWVRSDLPGQDGGKVAETAEVMISNTGTYDGRVWTPGTPPWLEGGGIILRHRRPR